METIADAGVAPGGDATAGLLARFGDWLDRQRGLSPVSIRNYRKQVKVFLPAVGGPGAVGELTAADVTGFVVDYSQGRNRESAKAMVTALRAFLRFAHATGLSAVSLTPAVPAVASWRGAGLPRSMPQSEVERLLAGCDQAGPTGLRDHAVLLLLARLGLRGAEVAGLLLADIDWRAGEITVTGKASRTERLPLPVEVGEGLARWITDGRPACQSSSVFVTVYRPFRPLSPEAIRAIMGRACDRAGLARRGAHRLRHTLASEMLHAGASLAEIGQVLRHHSALSTSIYAKVDADALRPLAQPWPGSGL